MPKKKVKRSRKPVRCIDTGKKYDSITSAAKALGVQHTSVMDVCYGLMPTVKGLRFEFVNPEDYNSYTNRHKLYQKRRNNRKKRLERDKTST